MICTAHQILFGDQIEKNEIDGTCSAYEDEKRCVQGFGGKTRGKKTTWETQAKMGG